MDDGVISTMHMQHFEHIEKTNPIVVGQTSGASDVWLGYEESWVEHQRCYTTGRINLFRISSMTYFCAPHSLKTLQMC